MVASFFDYHPAAALAGAYLLTPVGANGYAIPLRRIGGVVPLAGDIADSVALRGEALLPLGAETIPVMDLHRLVNSSLGLRHLRRRCGICIQAYPAAGAPPQLVLATTFLPVVVQVNATEVVTTRRQNLPPLLGVAEKSGLTIGLLDVDALIHCADTAA